MFNKIKTYIVGHKIISLVILIVVILVGHWAYKKFTGTTGDTRYISAAVTKGNIIVSVSGSGQVSASDQVNINPKVSGDITSIYVQNGQKVKAGALIAQIDPTDAQKAVRDAQTSLDTANLSLQQLENQDSNETLSANSVKVYNDAFGNVSDIFLDLPSTISGLNDLVDDKNISDNVAAQTGKTAQNYRNTAVSAFYTTDKAFEKNRADFQKLNYNSPPSDIENIINETYATEIMVADTVADFKNFLDYLSENSGNPSVYTSYQTDITSYANTTSSHISSLSSEQNSISNDKETVPNANLDIRNAQINVEQKENALEDAKETLADYSVRAPFDGIIASVALKKADSATNGTTIATLITSNQIAELSLNEVDVANVQVGQKATLTFDAIPDLTIAGTVAEIDSIGTVSQGVVNYNVKINFDTQDDRIKPGMSFSAEIISNIKQDVLIVPNTAIKTQGGASYVQIFNPPLPAPTDGLLGSISKTPPSNVPVVVGISNDTDTEIVSGLNEGDSIVTRTILPSATSTSTSSAPSLLSGGATRGVGGSGGNAGFRGAPTRIGG